MKSFFTYFILLSALFTSNVFAKDSLCTINGTPAKFVEVERKGSQFITTQIATLDEEAQLVFHFNPFYQIGGSVQLKTATTSVLLLRFYNGFESDITHSKVQYRDFFIECVLEIH